MVIITVQDYMLIFGATVGGNNMKHPDPKLHLQLSLVKSGVRILAGGALLFGSLWYCGICLIVAEAIGIAEELV